MLRPPLTVSRQFFEGTETSLNRQIARISPIRPRLLIRVPQRQSVFHPHAQRNACRRRDARLQSRSFARWNQWLTRSLNAHPALLRLSVIISQYFILSREWLL